MTYRAMTEVPPLVERARELAARTGFERSCTDEVGWLLSVLSGRVRQERVGEIGTGCGVGAAWLARGLARNASLATVEADTERAAAAQMLFFGVANVRVLHGDWRELLAHGPFDLLFVDVTAAKRDEPEACFRALGLGGTIVLDDLTPEDLWPPAWQGWTDPVRAFWLKDPRLIASELLIGPASAVILATRHG